MRKALAAAAWLAAIVGLAGAAPAADPRLHPLRLLRYEARVAIVTRPDERNAGRRQVAAAAGRPTEQRVSVSAGTLTGAIVTDAVIALDVVAITGDGGLVVDVSESGGTRTHPRVRVAVTWEGDLIYDPVHAGDLSEEETDLLRWLARGFIGDRPHVAGTKWTLDASLVGESIVRKYEIRSTGPNLLHIAVEEDRRATGVSPFEGHREGQLQYDPKRAVPVRAEVNGTVRGRGQRGGETAEVSLTLVLTQDVFPK